MMCESVGGKMAEPKSKEINDEIQKEASSVIGRGTWYWLGLNDEEKEGTWVYNSDGQKIEWSNWGKKEPSGGSKENCVFSRGHYNGQWFDYPCATRSYHFVCEF